MFEGMGIQWAATLLGAVAAALVPIPVIFYLYGHKIRAKSAFAPTPPPGALDSGASNSADDSSAESAAEKEAMASAASGNVPKRATTDAV